MSQELQPGQEHAQNQPVQPQPAPMQSAQPVAPQPAQPITQPQQTPSQPMQAQAYVQPQQQPIHSNAANPSSTQVVLQINEQEKNKWADIMVLVSGIADIVQGSIAVLGGILILLFSLFAGPVVAELLGLNNEIDYEMAHFATGALVGILLVVAVAVCIMGGLKLWVGITAVRHHNHPAKYGFLFAWSIVGLVLHTFSVFANFTFVSFVTFLIAVGFLAAMIWKRKEIKSHS